jgi:3-oxoacyl-[acyl-carrier protein] reductase
LSGSAVLHLLLRCTQALITQMARTAVCNRSGLTGFVAVVARSGIAAQGVTINGLLPGAFDTDRLRSGTQNSARKTGQDFDVLWKRGMQAVPAQRFGTAEEFGAVCAFICSVHAGYLNGQNVLLDGGAYPGTL